MTSAAVHPASPEVLSRPPHDAPVVTGLGVVSPCGLGTEAHWGATLAGHRGITPITRFDAARYPVRVAGQIPGFTASEFVPGRLIAQTDRWTQLGLAAAALALADARLDPAELPTYEMAIVTASSTGGVEFGQREIERLWKVNPRHVSAYQSIAWFYAATTGQISVRYGMRGPCNVIATEQAGGLDALGHARRLLRSDARMVLAGGTDAPLCPYSWVCQLSSGILSARDAPDRAYLPFDADADGYVPGEGGAMLVVENARAAAARSAPQLYGTIAGYAATFDPPPGSDRPPGLLRAVRSALDDARITPEQVDVVFADGSGVPDRDRQEAAALAAVFGPYGVPVTVPKTMTGRLYGGGSALDVVNALLAIRDGVIPPTVGVHRLPDDYRVDLVRNRPREAPVGNALVLARGFGGFNAALVVQAAPGLPGREPDTTAPDTTTHDTTTHDPIREK
ncbi:ketosynthase chain-length factor [Wenjunlia tyrosinilytica]|uniref:Actinorhodin polyketide beta-ketoacyl synthase n=1 Tax=Wenjunlia tyrosinilytica TaxID=1544741 RepID=A0A917ZWR6_9ACTN|nr:ketosynthase chain-length factor [Wenjunlia tyrosinilytica]GGO97277.1 actinorhodin polyketide beta-ketoacyl synthase [Wenjunlia tyrosinilytica]